MRISSRSHLTAGIAALGAGALALAPVQPIHHQVALAPQRVVENLAVELAASSIDPITPWVTAFETAGANIGTLFEFYLEKPFPILQTIGANIATYIEELGNGQGGLIPEQIWNNIVTFFEAPWSPGDGFPLPSPPLPEAVFLGAGEYVSETNPGSPFSPQSGLVGGIVLQTTDYFSNCATTGQDCDLPGQIATFSNFLNSHFSGQLLGLLGTVASPFVQLVNSFTAIGAFFEAGDVIGAINELINIPANMTNAFLNGAGYLDLTAIAEQFLPLPPGTIKSIGVNLGGLLNAVPLNGSLADPDNPPTEYSGGVGYDGIAADLGLVKFGGLPIGWVGSVIGLGQFVGEQMLVTPPETPEQAAAEATEVAAPVDIAPPVLTEAPAEVPAQVATAVVADIPAVTAEVDPMVADEVTDSQAEETTPTLAEGVEADLAEAVAAEADSVAVDIPEVEVPAEATEVADDPEPATSVGSDDDGDSGDTGSRASDSRRGAGSDD